jgi:putative ABC transport system substrate-binding protein
MKRREFIALLGGAAAWPMTVRAQQPERMRRIGVLLPATADDSVFQIRVGAFLQGLALLGWSIGQNVRIDIRWATANATNIRRQAVELAALAPDVILAHGGTTVGPLMQATRTVPIVFPIVSDPVAAGYVDSLARPGGNATGFMSYEYNMGGKRLELLKQIAPGVTRAAVLRDATQGSGTSEFAVIQALAPSLGLEVNPVNMRDAGEIERAVAAFSRSPNGGLIVTTGGSAIVNRDLIIGLAARHNCPPSTSNVFLSRRAASSPMELMKSIRTGARRAMSIVFLKVRSRRTCQCKRRTSTSWCSISRPPRCSGSKCRQLYSCAPTR